MDRVYVIILNLDEVGTARVRQIQTRLERAGIGPAVNETISPHVTLGAFGQIDLEATIEVLASFFAERKPEPLQFDILGSFPDTGVLHATPLVTARLLALHADLHAALAAATCEPYVYYRPGTWNPHCTMVAGLGRSELSQAFQVVVEVWQPFSAAAAEVALVLPGAKSERLYTLQIG